MTTDCLPPPYLLGAPARYTGWRPGQADAVYELAYNLKRFNLRGAPTGFGKTLTYICLALLTGKRICILTSTKALSKQIWIDWQEMGLVEIKGLNAYECVEGRPTGLFGDLRREGYRADAGLPMMCDEAPCQSGVFCRKSKGGCFTRRTSVLTSTGWRPIHTIKNGDLVATTFDDGSFGYTKVECGTYQRDNGANWLGVAVDGQWNEGVGSRGGSHISCTDDHVWYGPGVAKAAKDLCNGDKVWLPLQGSSDVIFGTILGDAHVFLRNKSAFLTVSHANQAWAERKGKHFDTTVSYANRLCQPPNATQPAYYDKWTTRVHLPKYWHSMFYKGGDSGRDKVWLPPPSMAALAVWYCDDGSIQKSGKSGAACFHIDGFSKSCRTKAELWLRDTFGDANLKGNGVTAYVPVAASHKLFTAIAPFVPPEMQYKLPEMYRNQYNGWMEVNTPQVGIVEDVRPENPTNRSQYCLVVPETHRFFTRAGLVSNCLYYDAYAVAGQANVVVTNYAYWMSINRWGEGLGKFDILVLDEAHNAIEELGSFVGTELNPIELEAALPGSTNVPYFTKMDEQDLWRQWAIRWNSAAVLKLEEYKEMIRSQDRGDGRVKINHSILRKARDLRRVQQKLETVATMAGDWVIEWVEDAKRRPIAKFDPVWPGEYAERYLFLDIAKVVMTSATVRPETADKLGVNRADMDFIEYPSTFNKRNRPVIFSPAGAMNKNSAHINKADWHLRMNQIIARRPETKGIIHTVSYPRAREVWAGSDFKSRMLMHDSNDTKEKIEEFKQSTRPLILVSPVLDTGYDFPHDQARWQIISKMPFPVTVEKIVQARMAKDPKYRDYVTMVKLVQMAGRIVRAEDDWGETFIVDSDFGWWYNKKGKWIAPKWFIEAVRYDQFLLDPLTRAAA